MTGLAILPCGCTGTNDGGGLAGLFQRPGTTTAPSSENSETVTTAQGIEPPRMLMLQVSFDLLRTRVPAGTFSRSGKIWNHLDEQVLPVEVAALLQRNGLRIGKGKLDAWRPIKALLEAERDVTSTQDAALLTNGLPLTIEINRRPQDQTLFLFRPNGSLVGAPLPASTNVIRVEYAVPPTQPESVELAIMPEIRLHAAEPELSLDPASWNRPLAPPSRILRELSARIIVAPGEFVALGPSPAAERAHTMGSLLLREQEEGREYESMYFITPKVSRRETVAPEPMGTAGPAVPARRP
ncbi:MAG: hypothetical protein AMXMBFR13_40350 [Phycisphaerae bacterium]